MSQAYDVFISYAREDQETARRLYRDLTEAGVTAWMDETELAPGAQFRTDIPSVIQSCSYFIVLVSSRSLSKRGYVQKELNVALEVLQERPYGDIFIVPVRIEDCALRDVRLRDLSWLDLFPSYEDGLARLLSLFRRDSMRESPSRHSDDTPPEIDSEVFGPLASLLVDAAVSAIMVNNWNDIFVDREGRHEKSPVTFASSNALATLVRHLKRHTGHPIDKEAPRLEGRLPDDTFFCVTAPAYNLNNASIYFRKPSARQITLDDLIKLGALSGRLLELLQVAVDARINVLISGGLGSGSLVWLELLCQMVAQRERIVVVDAQSPIRLRQPNVVKLQDDKTLSGEDAISKNEMLMEAALSMMPDRLVLTDISRVNALNFLKAMNGNASCSLMARMTSDSPLSALHRLQRFARYGNPLLPIDMVDQEIGDAIGLVVQVTRLQDGARKLTAITEPVYRPQRGFEFRDIGLFKQEGITVHGKIEGHFIETGYLPPWAQG